MILAAAAIAMPSQAQKKVNLNKGDVKVETVELNDGDYIAIGRPEGVPTQRPVEITNTSTTKNSIKYTILAKSDDVIGNQMVISKAYVDLLMTQLGMDPATCTAEELETLFKTLMQSGYGFAQYGTKEYTVINGEDALNGETQFILGGQDYYIVTDDLLLVNDQFLFGPNMSHVIVTTPEAGESSESLDVSYDGLDDNGLVNISITPGANIKTLHVVLGTTRSVDQNISTYGYGYVIQEMGTSFTADQWNELKPEDKKWNVNKEDDYSILVLGVDNEGNWVKKQMDNIHIKPVANNDCPDLNTDNFSIENGNLSASYSVKSKTNSPITKATVLLMDEDKWDNKLNDLVRTNKYEEPSQAWPDVMSSAEATDVTAELKDGKYTFNKQFTEAERGWYVLVYAVTDKNGTTITRTAFHTHIDAETETFSHTYPVNATSSQAKVAKAAKGLKAGLGKVVLKKKALCVKGQ